MPKQNIQTRGRGARPPRPQAPQEFEQRVLDVARTARVTAGGRRFNFRATTVIGDRKGRVGIGIGKGRDVSLAIEKSVRAARKHLIHAPITPDGTIPYEVTGKQTSAIVFLKPAREGRGIVAGGAVRAVADLAGYKNLSGKVIGRSTNKMNNAQAAINALKKVRYVSPKEDKNQKEQVKNEEEKSETEGKKKVKKTATKKDKKKTAAKKLKS